MPPIGNKSNKLKRVSDPVVQGVGNLCKYLLLLRQSITSLDLQSTTFWYATSLSGLGHDDCNTMCHVNQPTASLRGETLNYRSGVVAKELLKTVF